MCNHQSIREVLMIDPGFDIEVLKEEMDYRYGPDSFGPPPEKRRLDSIRKSLRDPDCGGPDPVYSIVMDVGKKIHRPVLEQMHLLYGVVTFAGGRLGREPVRSQGHLHRDSAHAGGWSTPELYEIWEGTAIIYMQEMADDDPGRCFAVTAGEGEVVMVPPGWAHMTINASDREPMTFGAWCDREYGFEYDKVRGHGGLAWFPLITEERQLEWEANDAYIQRELIQKYPRRYEEFGILTGPSLYNQFEEDPDRFLFISRPDRYLNHWKNFTP